MIFCGCCLEVNVIKLQMRLKVSLYLARKIPTEAPHHHSILLKIFYKINEGKGKKQTKSNALPFK